MLTLVRIIIYVFKLLKQCCDIDKIHRFIYVYSMLESFSCSFFQSRHAVAKLNLFRMKLIVIKDELHSQVVAKRLILTDVFIEER